MFEEYKSITDFKDQCGYVIDDVWFPRVTKIVSIKAKPALLHYYGQAESFKSAKEATEKSALEGTLIHETIEGILLGKNPTIDPTVAPAVKAFMTFYEKNGIH